MNGASRVAAQPLTSGNPCPFLRALVAGGWLPDTTEPLATVRDVIVQASGRTLPGAAIVAIALMANGLTPGRLLRNAIEGLHLNALRDGPLDKHGSGSRILDAQARFDPVELDRLTHFASAKTSPSGTCELGLSLAELTTMMDANFERARGTRRRVDRALMNGEWPVLLKVLGQDAADGAGRYLSVNEIRTLFEQRRLPERIASRLPGGGTEPPSPPPPSTSPTP